MKQEQASVDPTRTRLSQLLPEEAGKPFDILHGILDSYSASDLQDGLWELLYYAMASSSMDGLPSHARARYLDLYRALLRLTEAAALIDQYTFRKGDPAKQ